MGIDIRDGAQLECIQCALCIDACDDIMDRVGRPKGLIAYDTFANIAAASDAERRPVRLLRARTILYSALISGVLAIMAWAWIVRANVEISVIEDRNPLFVRLSDGAIRNGYTVKILNKTPQPQRFVVRTEGIPGTTLAIVGQESSETEVVVEADVVRALKLYVTVPVAAQAGLTGTSTPIDIVLTDTASGETLARRTAFRSPAP